MKYELRSFVAAFHNIQSFRLPRASQAGVFVRILNSLSRPDISEAKHANLAKRAADVTNQQNELLSTETRKRERCGRASEVVGRRKLTLTSVCMTARPSARCNMNINYPTFPETFNLHHRFVFFSPALRFARVHSSVVRDSRESMCPPRCTTSANWPTLIVS